MAWRNTPDTYGSMSKGLHWLIAIVVVALLIVGFVMTSLPKENPAKFQMYDLHKAIGICVLALMVFRLIWKLINPALISLNKHTWERVLEHSGHWTLYILLIAMPLSGWIMSTAAGKIPSFFGLFDLPAPGIPLDKSLAHFMGETHEILAWIIIVFLVLHVIAALKHHYIDKDNVLRRMMPTFKKKLEEASSKLK